MDEPGHGELAGALTMEFKKIKKGPAMNARARAALRRGKPVSMPIHTPPNLEELVTRSVQQASVSMIQSLLEQINTSIQQQLAPMLKNHADRLDRQEKDIYKGQGQHGQAQHQAGQPGEAVGEGTERPGIDKATIVH